MQDELLAQVVEEVSIVASEKRRKEPRTLPRPGRQTPAVTPVSHVETEQAGPTIRGHLAVAAAAAQRGRVNVGAGHATG